MAQDWTPKQQAFVMRFSNEVVLFLASADKLEALCTEFKDNFYGVGGANALTDAAVQLALPAATALNVSQAEGAIAGTNMILDMIRSQQGYLEPMRP
jgi:hypothetical protein